MYVFYPVSAQEVFRGALSIKDQIELVSSDEIDISDNDTYEDISTPFPWHEKYLIASLVCCLCAEQSTSETEKAELAVEAVNQRAKMTSL